jgi:hypothetical protein
MTMVEETLIWELTSKVNPIITHMSHLRASHDRLLAAAKALDAVGAHPPYMDNEFHKLRAAIAAAEELEP